MKRSHGGIVNPPCNRKGKYGNPSPTGWRARVLSQQEVRPTGAKVRSPLAWVVSVEKTKRMKPTDKAIFGMASESPGRNASEPSGGLDKK